MGQQIALETQESEYKLTRAASNGNVDLVASA
jgi:hypothetical protein